jgi:hypothetical protein
MGIEGLWTIQFRHSLKDFGAGVLVFTNHKVLGGDAGFWYSGDFSIDQENASGQVLVARFVPNYPSVFGDINQFELIFKLRFNEHSFKGTASMVGNPKLMIEVTGNKKQDL